MKHKNLNDFTTLLKDKSKNLYVYMSTTIVSRRYEITINAKLPNNVLSEISEFINEVESENVVLICRSEKEQYTHEFPQKEQIEFIKSSTNKKISVFYQNPWPERVPNFIDKDTTFIRFGYDEGCLFDNHIVEKKFESNENDGTNHYLINQNKLIKLKNRKTLT